MTFLFMPLFAPLLSSPRQGLGFPWLSPPCPQTCPCSASLTRPFFSSLLYSPYVQLNTGHILQEAAPRISSHWRISFRVRISPCALMFSLLIYGGALVLQPELPLAPPSSASSPLTSSSWFSSKFPHRLHTTPFCKHSSDLCQSQILLQHWLLGSLSSLLRSHSPPWPTSWMACTRLCFTRLFRSESVVRYRPTQMCSTLRFVILADIAPLNPLEARNSI